MSDYIPSTDEVLEAYIYHNRKQALLGRRELLPNTEFALEFHKWLAQRDEQ